MGTMSLMGKGAVLALLATLALAAPGRAQIERIELDIAGYLCGF